MMNDADGHATARHHHRHAKRDTVVQTDVVDSNIEIIVDQNGNIIGTSTLGTTPQTQAPAPAPAASSPAVQAAYAAPASSATPSSSAPAPASTRSSSSSSSASASASASPSASSGSSGSSGASSSANGIAYAPYNSDGSCKQSSDISIDFTKINGYGFVRLYGTDCNQVALVLPIASKKGMKVFTGVQDLGSASSEVQTIISAVNSNGGWGNIHTVSIGNELVNSGSASAGSVASAVGAARSQLRSAGYNGPVVTVDTFVAIINNPQLCQASDYAAANCHAFFDKDIQASGAGAYVSQQMQAVAKACSGKSVIITESGWPSQGSANGQAVPSSANQKSAISSLQSSFSSMPGNLTLFEAFNEMQKPNNPATFGAEQHWGILS